MANYSLSSNSSESFISSHSNVVTVEEQCIHVSEAIAAQGIDDVTSWLTVKFGFTIVYTTLFVIGFIGNGGVLVAVLHNKRLRSARNIFLLNLILTDLLLCLTGIPVTPWYALHKEWVFGSFMCRLMPLSNSCAVFVTSWSLTAIAADKFLHITDPTKLPVSIKRALLITLLIWIICSVINIPYLLSYELVDGAYYVPANATPFCGLYCDETNWQGENNRRIYGLSVMILQFIIPMAGISYCYWKILDKVHRDMIIQNVQFCQSLTSSQRHDAINRKKRVNYILIGMVLAFIGCWLPLTAVNLVKDFKVEPEFMRAQPYFWPLIAHVIAMSTVVWNPILFFWLTRKQKRSKLGGILHTSEVITSLASRINSLRSTSNGSTNESKLKKRHIRIESEKKKQPGNGGPFACQSQRTFNNRQSSKSMGVVASSTPRSSIQSNGTSITRPLVVSTSPENSSSTNAMGGSTPLHPMIQKTCSLKENYYNMI